MPSPIDVVSPVTIDNFGRLAWNNLLQYYPTAKMFFQKGNINRDQHGLSLKWPIKAGHNAVVTTADYEDVTDQYVMTRPYAQASIDWAQIAVFKALSKRQLKTNGGQEALVKFAKEVVPDMFRDALKGTSGSLFWQFYNRNYASFTSIASNSGRIAYGGLPSVFTGNTSITWSSTTNAGTINNTNYGGLSCVLNGLTTVDNVESDAWTPSAFNWSSTGWNSGSTTFRTNCFDVLTAAISASSRFDDGDPQYQPDLGVMTRSMYNDFSSQLQQKQSFLLEKAVGKKAIFGIGMDPIKGVEHNGVQMMWDFHIPAGEGYVLNFSQMWLDLMPKMEFSAANAGEIRTSGDEDSIFETEVDYNPSRRALTVSATADGQFRINPRYQTFFKNGA